MQLVHRVTQLFPLWALAFAALGYVVPSWFVDLKSLIIPLLILIMFSMGMTLTFDHFRQVLKSPSLILLGTLLQYSVMPLAAYLISLLLALPSELMVGMVLVGAASGGTASNVITYLARGDVALSVSLTLVSTLLAVIAMPYLTLLYVGQSVPVPVESMLLNLVKLVLAPVLLGTVINSLWQQQVKKLEPMFPLLSVAAIALIIAIVVALNQARLQEVAPVLLLAVVLHNLLGLLLGYTVTRLLGHDTVRARTLAIEVGMQNSGLSVALALKYFSPLAALPGALFSIWHNLSGSLLAAWWQRRKN